MKLTPDQVAKSGKTPRRGDSKQWISAPAITAAALLAVLVWSYWPTLLDLAEFWNRNPDYSGGMLMPVAVAYVLWSNRKTLSGLPREVCWWGLGLMLFAQAVRVYGLYDMYGSLERYSFVLTVAGMVLFILGFQVAWRLKWVFAFLLLMAPLPGQVHNAISLPLQSFATSSAVFGLEVMGYIVGRQGNVLRLSDQTEVAVAEACSGLRMLTAFVVVAAVLAFVVRRPTWQKTLVVLSSLPVAILANTLRLIVTVLLFSYAGSKTAERFFHDFAGICMMPFAVAVSVLELQLFRFMGGKSSREAGVRPALKPKTDRVEHARA